MPTSRHVVDLGAGTGAGSRLLRERYPDAAVRCVDDDPEMLELLREQGFAIVEADLNDGFPVLAGYVITADAAADALVDLTWASSSVHHITHPARLLSGVRRALAPGGFWSWSSWPPSPLPQPSAEVIKAAGFSVT